MVSTVIETNAYDCVSGDTIRGHWKAVCHRLRRSNVPHHDASSALSRHDCDTVSLLCLLSVLSRPDNSLTGGMSAFEKERQFVETMVTCGPTGAPSPWQSMPPFDINRRLARALVMCVDVRTLPETYSVIYKTSVSETIRKPSIVKAQTALLLNAGIEASACARNSTTSTSS